jgi:hypothetical protein
MPLLRNTSLQQQVERYELNEDEVVNAAASLLSTTKQALYSSRRETTHSLHQKSPDLYQKYIRKPGTNLKSPSLGEQSEETYRLWRDCGAQRYLLRIESASGISTGSSILPMENTLLQKENRGYRELTQTWVSGRIGSDDWAPFSRHSAPGQWPALP